MSSTTSRLLLLLSLLQARRDWSGAALADRLGISRRTVRRDVDRLREMGYRIEATMGPEGGYRLDAGSDLPPLLFDDDQVMAITVGLHAAATSGVEIEEAAVRALTTMRQVMPARLRRRLEALDFSTLPEVPGRAPREPVAVEALVTISEAIRSRQVLRFDYASASKPTAPAGERDAPTAALPPYRRAEPHHLVASEGRWYVVAWDLDRDDWRIFRVDRMTLRAGSGTGTGTVSGTGGRPGFIPRQLPTSDVHAFVSARFRGSATVDAWPCRGTVILELPASEVAPFAGDGTVVELGSDRCSLEAGAWSWRALAASFGRFDARMQVVGPPELAEAFAALAERYSAASTAATTAATAAAAPPTGTPPRP